MKNKSTILLISGAALLILGLSLAAYQTYKPYQVEIDGQSRLLRAFAWTVADGLRAAQVSVQEGDLLEPPAGQWLSRGSTIRIQRAFQVSILADGKLVSVLTTERLPVKILALAGIALAPGDVLLAGGETISPQDPLPTQATGNPATSLQIIRAIHFTLQGAGQPKELASTAATTAQALWEAGIRLNEADQVTPGLSLPLKPDLLIAIQPARLVTIHVQGLTVTRLTAADTVGEALVEAGVSLEGLDYSQPPETAPLPDDGAIRVVRVREETILEQSPLAYQSVVQAVDTLELDTQKIVQAGVKGLLAKRIRLRYEDGKEVSRTVEDQWVARPPQNQVTGYGTLIVKRTLDTPDGPITYWRALSMWATSYHPSETGSNETASGMLVRKGVVAVDKRYIPFHTQMYIPGYGMAVAGDTGGGVIGRMVDLGYPDADYIEWHQYVTVYFLWPPPENIVWVFPP